MVASTHTRRLRRIPVLILSAWLVGVFLLSGCSTQNAAPGTVAAPAGVLTPRAFVPAAGSAGESGKTAGNSTATAPQKRVLFIQGDHVPASGYPQSRVLDDGRKPESFSRLRSQVLEGDLKLGVGEIVLTKTSRIDAALLAPYAVVVLGSNDRALTPAEVGALTAYYQKGGSVLVYADSQFGPNNWDSDNSFIGQFGMHVLTDNYQPAVTITNVVSAHPIMNGVKAIRGEGISQFRISASALGQVKVLASCTPQTRSGCILPPADQATLKPGDTVACVVVRENAAGGRLAGVCDRNFFQNGPGPGSDLGQADDRLFARNLFRWLSKQ